MGRRPHQAGSELFQQRTKGRVGSEHGGFDRLVQFFGGFAFGFRALGGTHGLARRGDCRIVFGRYPGGFELLSLLRRERLELVAHVFRAVPGLADFVECRPERGIGGEHGGADRRGKLVLEGVFRLPEGAHRRIVFGFFAGSGNFLLLFGCQDRTGRRTMRSAVPFAVEAATRSSGSRLGFILGRERRYRRQHPDEKE